MTRRTSFVYLQLLYPQFTTTALPRVAVAQVNGPVLVSLCYLGCWGLDL